MFSRGVAGMSDEIKCADLVAGWHRLKVALEEILILEAPSRVSKQLPWMAVQCYFSGKDGSSEHTVQAKSTAPVNGDWVFREYEDTMRLAKASAGCAVSTGLLLRALLSVGAASLAAQFSRLATARRVVAHPAPFAESIAAVIQDVNWTQLRSRAGIRSESSCSCEPDESPARDPMEEFEGTYGKVQVALEEPEAEESVPWHICRAGIECLAGPVAAQELEEVESAVKCDKFSGQQGVPIEQYDEKTLQTMCREREYEDQGHGDLAARALYYRAKVYGMYDKSHMINAQVQTNLAAIEELVEVIDWSPHYEEVDGEAHSVAYDSATDFVKVLTTKQIVESPTLQVEEIESPTLQVEEIESPTFQVEEIREKVFEGLQLVEPLEVASDDSEFSPDVDYEATAAAAHAAAAEARASAAAAIALADALADAAAAALAVCRRREAGSFRTQTTQAVRTAPCLVPTAEADSP